MAARSAQRAGAGYVQVAVPGPVQQVVDAAAAGADDARGLPDEDGRTRPAGAEGVAEMAERAGAVVLGPGLGRARGRGGVRARAWRASVEAPLLVDADGLNAHAGQLELFAERSGPTVLTPHAGELGRLLELDSEEVEAARLAAPRARPRSAAAPWCS